MIQNTALEQIPTNLTEEEFNKQLEYYTKNPKEISFDLDKKLLLAVLDVNSKWVKYLEQSDGKIPEEFVLDAVKVDPTIFSYINKSQYSFNFLKEIIGKYPFLVNDLYYPNDDMLKAALSSDPSVISKIKKEYMNDKIANWVVEQNALNLKYIPKDLQSESMVLGALRNNSKSYCYAKVRTTETDIEAVKEDKNLITELTEIPLEVIDEALEFNPFFISYFIDKYGIESISDESLKKALALNKEIFYLIDNPSEEIVKFAVAQHPDLLDEYDFDEETLIELIDINPTIIKYIKHKPLTLIVKAMEQDVEVLDYIPNPKEILKLKAFELDGIGIKYLDNPTQEQCEDAVKRNYLAIQYVPEEYQTEEMQLQVINDLINNNDNPELLEELIKVPKTDKVTYEILSKYPPYIFKIKTPTDQMYQIAFETDGHLILLFDDWEEKFSKELKAVALSSAGDIYEYFTEKTDFYAFKAIESFPFAIRWVEYQTLEMAKLAVEKDVRSIYFVDPSIMDEELLNLAMEYDPDYFKQVSGVMTWEQWLNLINN